MRTGRSANAKTTKSYWEANLDGKQPTDSNMDSWIRAKYEQRLWVKNDDCSDLSKIAVNFVEEQVVKGYSLN